MLMLLATCALTAWCLLSVLVALAVGRAAKAGESEYQDQVFLRGVALEATHHVTERQVVLLDLR